MCGIVGIISSQSISHLTEKVMVMNDTQKHRGPDGEAVWLSDDQKVIFGHRRLSIIDLSDAGKQPMASVDGRYSIVFNGEIYNYQSLRQICEQKGSIFRSHTDTEVIIEYIRHFGINAVKDFRGMWAFVLHDKQENTISISRDPFGIKPLHYGLHDGCLYFASEIKSLRLANPLFNVIDHVTKELFLDFGYLDIGAWTFFENIKRFPAACYAVINLADPVLVIDPIPYWQPPETTIKITTKDAIKELDFLLNQSIQRHMVSDVPIAFCLSGGLDSSTTIGIAKTHSTQGQALNSFTTHYPNYAQIDESKWADMVVKHCGTTAHWIEPSFEEFQNEFDLVLHHHDEPFGSTSIFAQNSIFKAIGKSGIKVSLDGQGADEIFGGYHSYYYFYLRSLIYQKNYMTFLIEGFCLFLRYPAFLFDNMRYISRIFNRKKQKNKIYSDEYNTRLSYIHSLKPKNFREYLITALRHTSLPQLLRNGDRNSMKNGVESRVPYLDIDLVDFALSLPDNFRIHKAITKYLLRQVAYAYLPKELVDRKDKMGFPAPEKQWMKQAFDIDVNASFSKGWRIFIVKKWEDMIHDRI